MKNELLLSIENHTDTLTEPTKTRPKRTLENKLNKQMQSFCFSPPKNLLEESKWLLAVTSY